MFNEKLLIQEFNFKAIRSSGSGGQHVNKTSSKIELTFNVSESLILSEDQKILILEKLKSRLTKSGELIIQCSESRSQYRNKNIAIVRMIQLLKSAVLTKKKRIPTKTPRAVIIKRLKNKRNNAERKAKRRKPKLD